LEKSVVWLAFIALVVAVQFGGLASETIIAGNYSLTFNMTVPHQIQQLDFSDGSNVMIKTFDGRLYFMDWGPYPSIDRSLTWWEREQNRSKYNDIKYIGRISKNISGKGNEDGNIYVFGDRFEMVFNDFEIQSSLNLTQSIDFFRDVKIAWHENN